MKTILVTGALGFTGRHFIRRAMDNGYNCIGLVRDSGFDLCPYIEADLTDLYQLTHRLSSIDFQYVVHLGAVTFVQHDNISELYKTNLVGTLNLLQALLECNSKPQKVLLSSSGIVYGTPESMPIDESCPTAPVNDYGISKEAMEKAVGLRMKDLPIQIVRPFNYTGRGQASHFLVPKIVEAFKQKAPELSLGNLDVARDFSDVRDVCSAYLRLLESGEASSTVNICSGNACSISDIINMLSRISGHSLQVNVDPRFVRKNEIKQLFGSNQKLINQVGNVFKYTMEDTLRWMYEA